MLMQFKGCLSPSMTKQRPRKKVWNYHLIEIWYGMKSDSSPVLLAQRDQQIRGFSVAGFLVSSFIYQIFIECLALCQVLLGSGSNKTNMIARPLPSGSLNSVRKGKSIQNKYLLLTIINCYLVDKSYERNRMMRQINTKEGHFLDKVVKGGPPFLHTIFVWRSKDCQWSSQVKN